MFNSKLSNALKGNRNAAGKRNKILAGAGAAALAVGGAIAGKSILGRVAKATLKSKSAGKLLTMKKVPTKSKANFGPDLEALAKSSAINKGHRVLKSKLADVQARARKAGRI